MHTTKFAYHHNGKVIKGSLGHYIDLDDVMSAINAFCAANNCNYKFAHSGNKNSYKFYVLFS